VFDHVTIGASDREASRRFYATVLGALGRRPTTDDPTLVEWHDLSIAQAGDGRAVTSRLHLGFRAGSRADADAFWRAGVDAGYRSDGEPGPRPEYAPDYYGAFLIDPDGNSAEAVFRGDRPGGAGVIDHLWWRVAERPASRTFYATTGAHAGFAEVADRPNRTAFSPGVGRGTFSIVDGAQPTSPFHLAFAAPDHATVERFHAALTAAGYADNGGPGERPAYHPGYFGAFVLDPDGHNVELVDHGRRGG